MGKFSAPQINMIISRKFDVVNEIIGKRLAEELPIDYDHNYDIREKIQQAFRDSLKDANITIDDVTYRMTNFRFDLLEVDPPLYTSAYSHVRAKEWNGIRNQLISEYDAMVTKLIFSGLTDEIKNDYPQFLGV